MGHRRDASNQCGGGARGAQADRRVACTVNMLEFDVSVCCFCLCLVSFFFSLSLSLSLSEHIHVHVIKLKKILLYSLTPSFAAGESGLGKSTFVNALFMSDIYVNSGYPPPDPFSSRMPQICAVERSALFLTENGVHLRLTIIEAPGFGGAIDNRQW